MPIVRIDFDGDKLTKDQATVLSQAVQEIVSRVTGIDDVFIYANDSQVKIKIAPVEIFIEMSAHKISDSDKLLAEIKSQLAHWKEENHFLQPINLTLIPINWKIEIGI